MKRVPIFPCIVGLHAALAAAALLWALQARFGDPLTAALSPAWDSPWEQGKAAFFPLLSELNQLDNDLMGFCKQQLTR